MAKRYKVGYGKPPIESQFKKGRSGNPSGRPKGSRGLLAIQDKVFGEKVTVTENGRQRRVTKTELCYIQVANSAAKGDLRAMRLFHDIVTQRFARERPPISSPEDVQELTDEELTAIIRAEYQPWR